MNAHSITPPADGRSVAGYGNTLTRARYSASALTDAIDDLIRAPGTAATSTRSTPAATRARFADVRRAMMRLTALIADAEREAEALLHARGAPPPPPAPQPPEAA